MKKIFLILILILTAIAINAQTSRFQRNFTTTAGAPLTGFTNYIWLVPQANTYPTGALALTEDGTRPGVYYRLNVPDGEYKIYIDTDKGGANTPILFLENYWVGEKRLSTIADHFDAADQYKLKGSGIKDGAITTGKILDNAVTTSKIINSAITSDKINSGAVTNDKILDLSVNSSKLDWGAVTSGKILDANVTLPKLSQAVLDYINAAGGGTITNNPDDVTLETKPGSTIGIKRNQPNQLNFINSIKLGIDTTLQVGKNFNSNAVIGLDIKTKSGTVYGLNKIFVSTPVDANTGAWTLSTSATDWIPANPGHDHILNLSYNYEGVAGIPQFGWQFEPNYEVNDTTDAYEWFSFFNNLPSPSTTYSIRPFQMVVSEYEAGGYESQLRFDVDKFWLIEPINESPRFKMNGDDFTLYRPFSIMTADSSSDNLIIGGSSNSKFISFSPGYPIWRLGTDNANGFELWLGTFGVNYAANPGTKRFRFDNDNIYFYKPLYIGADSNGVKLSGGSGNATLKASQILTLDASAFWVRNSTGSTSYFKIEDSGASITFGNTSYAGTGTVYTGKIRTQGAINFGYGTGGTDDYVVSIQGITAYTDGQMVMFLTDVANTDGATLNINSLGAKTLYKQRDQALVTGDFESSQIIIAIYDGNNFQVISELAQ